VRAFLKATEREHLLDDPRFTTVAGRARHVAQWFEIRGADLTSRTTQQWLEVLQAADIAAQPCNTLDTLPKDLHLKAVGLIDYEDHPTEGRTASIRSSLRVDDKYLPRRTPAQPRGADSQALLNELGYGADEIAALQTTGAVQAAA
jgi:crotonobetainyl-CoA:carnitine CoA-transferase CaiB-like acyl-CoA transferase